MARLKPEKWFTLALKAPILEEGKLINTAWWLWEAEEILSDVIDRGKVEKATIDMILYGSSKMSVQDD